MEQNNECNRCKKQNPPLNLFKVGGNFVCQGCYKDLTTKVKKTSLTQEEIRIFKE